MSLVKLKPFKIGIPRHNRTEIKHLASNRLSVHDKSLFKPLNKSRAADFAESILDIRLGLTEQFNKYAVSGMTAFSDCVVPVCLSEQSEIPSCFIKAKPTIIDSNIIVRHEYRYRHIKHVMLKQYRQPGPSVKCINPMMPILIDDF